MYLPWNSCKVSSAPWKYNCYSFSLLRQNLTGIFRVLYYCLIFFQYLGQYFQNLLFWVSEIIILVNLWLVLIFKGQVQLPILDRRWFLSIPWKKISKSIVHGFFSPHLLISDLTILPLQLCYWPLVLKSEAHKRCFWKSNHISHIHHHQNHFKINDSHQSPTENLTRQRSKRQVNLFGCVVSCILLKKVIKWNY